MHRQCCNVVCRSCHQPLMDDLQEMINERPSLFLDKISEWLTLYHDQPISTTALHNNLCDLELTYRLLCRIAAECNDVAHTEWLHEIAANYMADQMVFMDGKGISIVTHQSSTNLKWYLLQVMNYAWCDVRCSGRYGKEWVNECMSLIMLVNVQRKLLEETK